jgi:uncharacterized protein (TIGR03546 family)
MYTIFKIVKKILNNLNSNEKIENIALSVTIAIIYSMVPFNLIFHPFLFFLIIILNGNLLFFLFLTPLFYKIMVITYPLSHIIGNLMLGATPFQSLYERIYTIPILNYLEWYNTVTFGAYIFSALLCFPLYFLSIRLIKKYRSSFLPQFKKSKVAKIFKIPTWLGPS